MSDSAEVTQEVGAVRRSPWAVLAVLCGAQLMAVIDGTVVNVALPSISRGLSFPQGGVQLVVTVYLLCTGGTMLLTGRLADRFGPRRILLLGTVVFGAASLLSGLSPAPAVLVAARAAQGSGAALMTPAGLSIITRTYDGPRRAVALGAWGAVAAGGFVAGLLVGGVITTLLGWRWIFFVNVPLAALVVALVPALLSVDPDRNGSGEVARLPVSSALTLTAGLVAIVYGIGALQSSPPPVSAGTLALGTFLLAAFAILDRRSEQPMLAPALLRTRSLVAGSALMLATTGLLSGTLFVTTFYLQRSQNLSPLETGLAYLPFALAIAAASYLGPHLLQHLGTRVVATAGVAAIAAGAIMLALVGVEGLAVLGLLPAFLVLGAGTGLALVSANTAALADVPGKHAGAASGLLMTGHEAGGALGVAVLSVVAAAAGAGAPVAAQVAAGHQVAWLVTAGIAAGVALLGAIFMPGVRPSGAGVAHMHHG